MENKRAVELAKQALMEKRTNLARQMAECDEAYKALDSLLEAVVAYRDAAANKESR